LGTVDFARERSSGVLRLLLVFLENCGDDSICGSVSNAGYFRLADDTPYTVSNQCITTADRVGMEWKWFTAYPVVAVTSSDFEGGRDRYWNCLQLIDSSTDRP
jgi:hypothetical protein